MFQHMLGVCGASLVLPGWLVLGVMVDTGDVQTLNMPFQIILGRPTHLDRCQEEED